MIIVSMCDEDELWWFGSRLNLLLIEGNQASSGIVGCTRINKECFLRRSRIDDVGIVNNGSCPCIVDLRDDGRINRQAGNAVEGKAMDK